MANLCQNIGLNQSEKDELSNLQCYTCKNMKHQMWNRKENQVEVLKSNPCLIVPVPRWIGAKRENSHHHEAWQWHQKHLIIIYPSNESFRWCGDVQVPYAKLQILCKEVCAPLQMMMVAPFVSVGMQQWCSSDRINCTCMFATLHPLSAVYPAYVSTVLGYRHVGLVGPKSCGKV